MKKVSKTQVEEKLNTAVSHAVPDVKEQILRKCNETTVNYVHAPAVRHKRRYRQAVYARLAVAAAAILLLVNLGVLGLTGSMKQTYTTIDIDVNPSIELKVNSKDRIVSVKAVNEDALRIIDGLKLEGTDTNIAVNAILGSMLNHGYLSDNTRTILVSVDSKDKKNAVKVQESIAKDIGNMLDTYSVQATVVSQTMVLKDAEVSSIADEYGISQGKAEFVQKISSASEEYNPEMLSTMSITELDEIWGEVGDSKEVIEIITTGEANADLIINSGDIDDSEDDNVVTDSEDENKNDGNSSDDNDVDSDDEDSVSNNSVSDNTVSDNSVSDNSVSDNSVSNNSVSNNSVSNNSVSSNSVSNNSVSNNSVSANSVSDNSVSDNSVTKSSDSKSSNTKSSDNKSLDKKTETKKEDM